jgi:hypothetical protein
VSDAGPDRTLFEGFRLITGRQSAGGAVVVAIAAALQFLPPFPVPTWLGAPMKMLFG